MITRKIKILIYKFSRFIERYPSITLGLYNNISLFSFFLNERIISDKNKIYIKSELIKSLRFDNLNIKHKPKNID